MTRSTLFLFLTAALVLSHSNPSFAKTRMHCFDLTGKILDSTNQPIANAMIIFNPGSFFADTVFTDKAGNYRHTEAWWPPCGRRTRKFRRSEQKITVSFQNRTATVTYVPGKWARVCEGEKIPVRKVMRRDIII